MVRRAQRLRQRTTRSEEMLWEALRNRRLQGAKFRRQQVLGRFIADFCSPAHRLVVEIDGSAHDDKHERDAQRDAWMLTQGWRVLRLPASMVEEHLPEAVALIASHLPSPMPTPGLSLPSPPPLHEAGEGGGG